MVRSQKQSLAGVARVVLGLSAAVYGVASLMGRESEMWQRARMLPPAIAPAAAWVLTIALVAGGIAMLVPAAARCASAVLGCVFGVFTLACVSDIIAAPTNPASYVDIFEQCAVVCGALAVYASTEAQAQEARLARMARVALGVCAISFAWAQVAFVKYTASLVPTWIPPSQMFWTLLTTVAFGLAATAVLLDRQARGALRLMALMLASFGVLVWLPHIVTHPRVLSNWTEFGLNCLIAAASLLVAELAALP